MRLLLDENLPKRLKQDFKEQEIYTAADKGWTGISNGKLLGLLTENKFDALLTFDNSTLKDLVQKIKDVLTANLNPGPIEIRLEGPAGNNVPVP